MTDRLELNFTRQMVEAEIGGQISDDQWKALKFELEDALHFYFKDEIPRLWSDIEEIVSEMED